jgi:hypothetical protein
MRSAAEFLDRRVLNSLPEPARGRLTIQPVMYTKERKRDKSEFMWGFTISQSTDPFIPILSSYDYCQFQGKQFIYKTIQHKPSWLLGMENLLCESTFNKCVHLISDSHVISGSGDRNSERKDAMLMMRSYLNNSVLYAYKAECVVRRWHIHYLLW